MSEYFIEVEADGWPRDIGPFGSREAARFWLEDRILNGSWALVPLTKPSEAHHMGRP
jgi:hypothetical protein